MERAWKKQATRDIGTAGKTQPESEITTLIELALFNEHAATREEAQSRFVRKIDNGTGVLDTFFQTLRKREEAAPVRVLETTAVVLASLGTSLSPFMREVVDVLRRCVLRSSRDDVLFAKAVGMLAQATGQLPLLSAIRPDFEDPSVRPGTSKTFAFLADEFGLRSCLPFLSSTCSTCTGIKTVGQIAKLMGPRIQPDCQALVRLLEPALVDDVVTELRQAAVCSVSSLAKAVAGVEGALEYFDDAVRPLWRGFVNSHSLLYNAHLKTWGSLIPLMEPRYAEYFFREIMHRVLQDISRCTRDEQSARMLLTTIARSVPTPGVPPKYVREEVLPLVVRAFWPDAAPRHPSSEPLVDAKLESAMLALASCVGSDQVIAKLEPLLDLAPNKRKWGDDRTEVAERVMGRLCDSHRMTKAARC